MLYPVVNINPSSIEGMHVVPPGNLVAVPLSIISGQVLKFVVLQNSPTQDFSMRAWISITPGGATVGNTLTTQYWPVVRYPDVIVLHDMNVVLPDVLRTIPVLPGSYTLNVLNLVNEKNVFTYSTDMLGLGL